VVNAWAPKLLLATAFAGGIAAGGAGSWLLARRSEPPQRSAAELMDVVMWNREPVGGAFALIDHTGKPRTDADFRGKLLLIYFGFTYCSDVCPTDLQAMGAAVDQLGPAGELVQPLFITVDPEMDTPEQLKAYVALFHPRLIGLTGGIKQIRSVAQAYKAYFAKTVPGKGDDRGVDHFGLVYLVDVAGKYVGFFPPGTSAERMVQEIKPQLAALAATH
jgi:cytochrome oxidase Cu insertion factor (SCO1/SenC/PrrC family)